MAENRLDREHTTREKDVRKRAWQRPETLPSPTPQDGYEFHWVRVSTQGLVDATNVSSKLREGWEPLFSKGSPRDYISNCRARTLCGEHCNWWVNAL